MSVLAIIELDYSWADKLENHESIREHFPKFYDADGKPKGNWELGEQIVDGREMSLLSEQGVIYTVHRFKGVVPVGHGDKIPEGSIVHIHLPNYVLNHFNKVELLEDCCTDALQEKLDEGWRIIAVCPPVNKRRPD